MSGADGSLEYEGPDGDDVVGLMAEVVAWLATGENVDFVVRAAMGWEHPEAEVGRRGWPERLTIALEQSLVSGLERGRYRDEADISPATASADCRRLLDAGLVVQRGRGRNIGYLASSRLREAIEGAGAKS